MDVASSVLTCCGALRYAGVFAAGCGAGVLLVPLQQAMDVWRTRLQTRGPGSRGPSRGRYMMVARVSPAFNGLFDFGKYGKANHSGVNFNGSVSNRSFIRPWWCKNIPRTCKLHCKSIVSTSREHSTPTRPCCEVLSGAAVRLPEVLHAALRRAPATRAPEVRTFFFSIGYKCTRIRSL